MKQLNTYKIFIFLITFFKIQNKMESDEQHKRKSISYDEEFKNQNISNGKSIHKEKIKQAKK